MRKEEPDWICIQMEASVHLIRCERPNRGSDDSALGPFCGLCACWLPQTETVVGVHHYVSACSQTVNEIWIRATEIWIIWIISIPPTYPSASVLNRLAVMFYVSLLSFVSFPFLFRSRPKGGSAEERKGVGEGRVVAFRPDVAYNLLHTLFFGLLAFSTMRWAHAHARVIAGSCARRYLDSHTFPIDTLV